MAVFIMSIFSIVVVAIYSVLEAKTKIEEAKRYAQKIIIKQMALDEEMEKKNKKILHE